MTFISDCLIEITVPVDQNGPHVIGVAAAPNKRFPNDTQVSKINPSYTECSGSSSTVAAGYCRIFLGHLVQDTDFK